MNPIKYEPTKAERARAFAVRFRYNHPELVRDCVVNLESGEGLTYGEVPVFDSGDVGLYRKIGTGENMKVTTGNILIYNHGDYWDYSVIMPRMANDDTFTEDECRVGEDFITTYDPTGGDAS